MGLFAFPFGWLIGPPMAIALWAALYLASVFGYFGGAMGMEKPGRDHVLMALWGIWVATVAVLRGSRACSTNESRSFAPFWWT